MALTAYDTLNQNFLNVSADLKTAKDALTALQNDSLYVYDKGRLAQLAGRTNGDGEWVDSHGTIWRDSTTQLAHTNAAAYVKAQDDKITKQNEKVIDLTNQVKAAQKALTDYSATPSGQATIAAISTAQKQPLYIAIVAVIGVVIILGIVMYFKNKNKTKTA